MVENLGNRWSPQEDDLFRRMAEASIRPKLIAAKLNRSVHAVRARAYAIGLPLKWFRLKAKGKRLPIFGVTWAQVGRITEPGRYVFKFGWLTVTAEDLNIWKQFPAAIFTLVPIAPSEDGEEYHLGLFDVGSAELKPDGP